jgi:hypothetical protein
MHAHMHLKMYAERQSVVNGACGRTKAMHTRVIAADVAAQRACKKTRAIIIIMGGGGGAEMKESGH